MDEGEVLVRVTWSLLFRPWSSAACRLFAAGVVAVLVLLEAGAERRVALDEPESCRHAFLASPGNSFIGAVSQAASSASAAATSDKSPVHWNLCRIFTAPPP